MEFKDAFEQARVLEETQACGNTAKVARALYRHIRDARALEPQGQALCHVRYRCSQRWDGNGNNDPQIYEGWEVCEAHERGDDGSAAIAVFSPNASQLALPAGPVPLDVEIILDMMRQHFSTKESPFSGSGTIVQGGIGSVIGFAHAIRAMQPSPAVEQPDKLAKLKDPHAVHVNMLRGTIAKIGMRELAHVHGEEMSARWQRFEEWEASQAAVAQPVADEREALTDAEIMDIARECEDEYCFPINHKQFARKLLARAALCQPAEQHENLLLREDGYPNAPAK